jgi:putative endonuclease
MKQFAVYILASKPRGTLYIGVTSNLVQRVWQHRNHVVPGFTHKYDVVRLVYFEMHESAEAAIHREKRLKHWLRQWKIDLIEKTNPEWRDLFDEVAT